MLDDTRVTREYQKIMNLQNRLILTKGVLSLPDYERDSWQGAFIVGNLLPGLIIDRCLHSV